MCDSGVTSRSQHLTACLECEEEVAVAWCEECRTSLCKECDEHQHHPKSLRREHVRVSIKLSATPTASTSRVGLLSKAFAVEGSAWEESSQHNEEGFPEDFASGSCLTSETIGDFSPRVKLESGTSHHALKSKRKHKKKKRGKSKEEQEKVRVGEEKDDSSSQKEVEHWPKGEEKGASKDGDSPGSSSVENQADQPAWKKHKSSLKGSHEAAGKGPRRSLHVHWSPDVKDHNAEDHSPTYGSPRRFVPFISNRRKKYAEKHHKKHHKGEHSDKRGKGKGRKNHESPRQSGARKEYPGAASGTPLSDASESADSDAFSPDWSADNHKAEETSDDSSFEDKLRPSPRAEVQLTLPEAIARSENKEETDVEQKMAEGSKAGVPERKSATWMQEAAVLKAVPFGEIVSSSGAEDTGEESVTEDDSMAGGMDLDSSETEMLGKEPPPPRSWKWFERFIGKKKGDALDKGRPGKLRKASGNDGLSLKASSLGPKATEGRGPSNTVGDVVKPALVGASSKESPEDPGVEEEPIALKNARYRVSSAKETSEKGDFLRAACEYEAAIRFFRSQSSGAKGRLASEGEAQAWLELAALQKRERNLGAAGRSHLAAMRIYKSLEMEQEAGECLRQIEELQKIDAEKTDQAARTESVMLKPSDSKSAKEAAGERTEAALSDNSKQGGSDAANALEQVISVQGSTVANSSGPHPVQSGSTKQEPVYSKDEAKGATSKRSAKKKGRGKETPEAIEASAGVDAPVFKRPLQQKAQPNQHDSSAPPDDVSTAIAGSRLSGASALASGDTDKGRAILVGALVAARKAGVKVEEARCQRLLADSQTTEEQRARALELAVEGLRVSGLRLEEAEALYRLADAKMALYIRNKAAIQAAVAGVQGQEDVKLLESAQKNLLSAADILQEADLWGGSKVEAPAAPPREILSPTRTNRPEVVTAPAKGRIAARYSREGGENADSRASLGGRGSKGLPVRSEREVRSLRELYGAVCQGVGKASILLGQMSAAKRNFQEALLNREWTAKHGDEAKRVQDIMGRLPR